VSIELNIILNPTPHTPLTLAQVVLWNLAANDCLPPLQAHNSTITGASFSPDSAMLATCSAVSAVLAA